MVYALLRAAAGIALRWFYRDIQVVGAERVPRDRPLLVVVNHPNALVDVWQPDGEGVYEAQKPGQEGAYLRGVYSTDKNGRYVVRTVAPIGYTIPLDGPVGDMVTRTGISPYRPTHVHFDVSAEGFSPVVTHIFRNGVAHLDDDVVFAVKDRLIVDFVEQKPGVAPNGERIATPYLTAEFDFVLAPAQVPALSA